MRRSPQVLPQLTADLLLLHAPAFFDFRNRRDIYFPFLGTSGDVPITPLYEYFPIGFKTLRRYLSDRGYDVKIINLATVLLRYPGLDLSAIVDALDVKLVGIDLHWLVHVQGSLAVADEIKRIRPDQQIIFGGISSTYYARELIHYPSIDMVMRGYDTHRPMAILLDSLQSAGDLGSVPNLLWKSEAGKVEENGLSHTPDTFGCGVDWTQRPAEVITDTFPILEVLSTQNAGCLYNCGWCGGSREAFRRVYGRRRTIARRSEEEIQFEFKTLDLLPNINRHHLYSVGSYNHSKAAMEVLLDRVAAADLKSVSYEQYHLTSDDLLERMTQANSRTTITLSPESHDLRVAKLAGRGVYSNDELEQWLERAFAQGIHGVDVWYFIGMPEQDEDSVHATVDYCEHLLDKFNGTGINPMICPMIPFLDPASTFFEHPSRHGYRVFFRTLEDHRRGMMRASIINRINYESKWLTRSELVRVGYQAVRRLMLAKGTHSMLPQSRASDYAAKIDDALEFIDAVHEVDLIPDEAAKQKELSKLGDQILERNRIVLFSGVSNQAFPFNREIGGRWFDEQGWRDPVLESAIVDSASSPSNRSTPGVSQV